MRGFLLILCLGTVACHPPTDTLVKRASFDLKCPKEQLTVSDLGERTKGVTGCDKQATYVFRPSHQNKGDWIMNTASGEPGPTTNTPSNSAPSTDTASEGATP